MTETTYTCQCGAVVRYRQDLEKEPGTIRPQWKCCDCGTPIPGLIAEKVKHQHPS